MGRLLRCPSPIDDQDSCINSKRTVPQSTYSTCSDFHLLDWDAPVLPSHRLIARLIELCLRCDALPTRLSAPVHCRRIKPKAYCSQRCHSPAKTWWWHLVTLVPPCLSKDLTRAFLSLSLSSLTLELFEAIAFWNVGVPSLNTVSFPYFSPFLLLLLPLLS